LREQRPSWLKALGVVALILLGLEILWILFLGSFPIGID
jgi:hypothetical protein